eukprot:7226632-Ditylum_brightwellii.AAC.1
MQTDLTGDSYLLYEDSPDKMFLPKGATFHLLGSSSLPKLIKDDEKYDNDQTIKQFTLNTTSDLYSSTFCRGESEKYQFDVKVGLDSAYDCHVQECYVESFIPNVIVLGNKVM